MTDERQSSVDTSEILPSAKGSWKEAWLAEPARDWSDFRYLLEQYSGISSDKALEHITAVRAKAYEKHAWPCLGLFAFLTFTIAQHPFYPEVLRRLKTKGQHFLDVGCCLGQDIRKLAFDGVSSSQLYGADLHREFIDYGYELFNDKDKLQATFATGSILDDPSDESPLQQLVGKVDLIEAAYFLHVFSWEGQVTALVRLVGFLKPDSEDAVIFGWQLGMREAGTYADGMLNGPPTAENKKAAIRFKHNAETFRKMFEEVGERTGTRWDVKATVDGIPVTMSKQSERLSSHIWISFEAHRLLN